ncbi:MAG: type II toxin-antitoxin system VapC family toxin [Thermoplasmata archaeon]
MKGLDTPVLLAILHDAPASRALLKGLRGEELATTEINLFELTALAASGPAAQREHREAALSRLRRRVTVLPVTAESVRDAGRLLKGRNPPVGYRALIWGTLSAAGCGEWITTKAYAPPKPGLPFKLRLV